MPRLFAILCLLALGLMPCDAATKRKKPSADPDAPLPVAKAIPIQNVSAVGKPNIVFIIVDDLNDWVGWLGGHPQARTPNMDRLAKMGMRFTNAHTAFALCNPSRTAMLTGMLPSNSGVFGNEQDWRRSVQIKGKATLPEYFRTQGYETAAGGKVFHANHGGPDAKLAGWHGGRRGFEQDEAWGTRFPEHGVQLAEAPVHTGRNFNGLDIWHWDWGGITATEEQTEDGQTVAWFKEYLANYKAVEPFFVAVGIYKPHSPWYVPQSYLDERPLDQVKLPAVKEDDLDDVPEFAKDHLKGENYHAKILKNNLWQSAVRAYLAAITFADAQVGKVLDALAASPQAANTIIVLTSDHGWYLGEKQMWHKGKLWERATHVPLTVFAPGVTKPDSASNHAVSLLDLYPTFCALTQVEAPPHLDGESLVPLLTDPNAVRTRPAITTMGGETRASYAARTDQWRYIRYADGSEELYDHSNDPNEWTNLAAKPESTAIKAELAKSLPKEWHSAHRPLSDLGQIEGIDGALTYDLQPGDSLDAAWSPPILGRGIRIDAAFEYKPEVDEDSTLLSQGDDKDGWALHLVAGKPTLTVFVGGQRTLVDLDPLTPGFVTVRAMIPGNGTLSLAVPGVSEIIDKAPFPAGFPMQPNRGIHATESFGPLTARAYPNSTPFDGPVHRLRLTVLAEPR